MPEFLNNAQYNFQTTGCTIASTRNLAPKADQRRLRHAETMVRQRHAF